MFITATEWETIADIIYSNYTLMNKFVTSWLIISQKQWSFVNNFTFVIQAKGKNMMEFLLA